MADSRSNSLGGSSPHDQRGAEQSTSTSNAHPAVGDGRTSQDRAETARKDEQANALYNDVLHSEQGVAILLERLKQSIASVREFAGFAKERGAIEEKHAAALMKLSESGQAAARRGELRQGSYSHSYGQMSYLHTQIAQNEQNFGVALSHVYVELMELSIDKERTRKQLKHESSVAEKRVQDAEMAMQKAKGKYNSLAEDYDRARTGDRQSGRFGLKGPKSAAQVEEELHRKMQSADSDYATKVQQAQSLRADLVNTQRPQAVKTITQLVQECDAALTLHLQNYAKTNEATLMSIGMCVSSINKDQHSGGQSKRGLRDIAKQIDNSQDLKTYVLNHAAKIGPRRTSLRYERHPSQAAGQQQPVPQQQQQQQQHQAPPASIASRHQQQFSGPSHQSLPHLDTSSQSSLPPPQQPSAATYQDHTSPESSFSPISTVASNSYPDPSRYPARAGPSPPAPYQNDQLPPYQHHPNQSYSGHPAVSDTPIYSQASGNSRSSMINIGQNVQSRSKPPPNGTGNMGPPMRPSLGLSLEELFMRDGTAVPAIVSQCLQAVELFGLDVEGIYRMSGSQAHVTKLREMFDYDAENVDFRNPEAFFHDINSVCGLLKIFFKELPDPLFTAKEYNAFIQAAHLDDDIERRDTLHQVINVLPDGHYATLRALTLHLHRVAQRQSVNKMGTGNLAICFAPTLMVSNAIPNIADAGWQVRVVDSVLQNALQIFDED